MIWLIFGGVGVLVVGALVVWAVVALFAEVGDEQEAATDEPEPDAISERIRVRSRAARH